MDQDKLAEQLATGIRLWTLIHPPPHVGDSVMGVAEIDTTAHGRIAVLFTDPHLSVEFASRTGPARLGSVNFTDPGHVRQVLELLEKKGVSRVGVDYFPADGSKPERGEVIPVRDAIARFGS